METVTYTRELTDAKGATFTVESTVLIESRGKNSFDVRVYPLYQKREGQ